jgi:glutamyl-tRNA reductase
MTEATQTPVREEWLTLSEACALVGVSPATLRRWSDNGDIRSFTTPGGHRRFARSAILDLLPAPADESTAASPDGASPPVAAAGPPEEEVDPVLPGLLVLASHARQVPSAAREAYAAELAELEPNEATIVVHTCHRVELYVARGENGEPPLPEPPPGTRRLEGADAARHLVAVACGLDSAVLGENQVLHQVRETLKQRRTEHPLDPSLDRLFQISLHAGRRARSWLSGTKQSLADVALERIAQRAGDPEGRPLLVVGAGVMGRLAAFAAARRGAEVIVTSRTGARAAALAREVGGRTAPFKGDGVVPQVDGALVALCGTWRVGEEDVQQLAESGAMVVDMSSPPAVTEAFQARLGDCFVSTDELAGESGFEPQGRLRRRLEELVDESSDAYRRWLHSRNALPAIKAIGEAADEQRRQELEWLFRRLPGVAEKDRSLIEQMSHRLVAGILHAPRSALNSDESGELAQAARNLFGT